MLSELLSSGFEGNSEAAVSLLEELAREQALITRRPQEGRPYPRQWENNPPLQKLPPGEWRSLGGYFDYCLWADRDRFIELDKAIAANQGPVLERDPGEMVMTSFAP